MNRASVTLALAGLAVAAPAEAGVFRLSGQALGAPLSMAVAVDDADAAQTAVQAAQAEIARLDAIFNDRRADSELSRLNASPHAVVSPELFEVIAASERWRLATGGAHDGRLGAALALWREAADTPPARADLQRAIDALGEVRLLTLGEAELRRRVLDIAQVLDRVAHGPPSVSPAL